eukprot:gene18409-25079_t
MDGIPADKSLLSKMVQGSKFFSPNRRPLLIRSSGSKVMLLPSGSSIEPGLAKYLHEPGDAKDGVTVEVPLFALNQVNEERCEWLVPGMLEAKVMALVKSLHQKPRARLVPLPDFVAEFCELAELGQGPLVEVLLKAVRERSQVAVQRNDFKLEQL